jgi:hypothetical protein
LATANKQASMSKYEFWLSNNTSKILTGTPGTPVDFGTINSESNLTLYARATDSRGNYTTISKPVTCYPYFLPYLKSAFTTKRSKDGTQITCEYNIAYAPVNNTNKIKIVTKYRAVGESDWATMTKTNLTADGGSLSSNIDITNLNNSITYEVCATIQDLYGGEVSTSTQTVLGAGRIFNVPLNGRGFALGKVSEEDGFECAWDATFFNDVSILGDISIKNQSLLDLTHPIGSVFTTSTNINPSTTLGGTWELINKSFANYSGNNSTLFTPTDKVSSCSVYVNRNGSSVRLRIYVVLATDIADAVAENSKDDVLGSVQYDQIGIASLPFGLYQYPCGCDGADAVILCELNYGTGELSAVQVIPEGNKTAKVGMYLDATFVIPTGFMLDEFCDEFHWKRIE